MSDAAWCALNIKCDRLKLHDRCRNPKSKGQKQITFTAKQLPLEVAGLQSTMEKYSKGLK